VKIVRALLVIQFLEASAALALGCESEEGRQRRLDREAWEEPCHDEAKLLATTAGSPSDFKCPNKNHRMEVQVATHPSNEEAAAAVLCRCLHARGDAGAE
jgi:hypothetical protein